MKKNIKSCITESLCWTADMHTNTVKQLYFNKIKFLKRKKKQQSMVVMCSDSGFNSLGVNPGSVPNGLCGLGQVISPPVP